MVCRRLTSILYTKLIQTPFATSNNCFIAKHTIEELIETKRNLIGTMEPWSFLKKK